MSSSRRLIHSKRQIFPKTLKSNTHQWVNLTDSLKARIDTEQNLILILNLETGIESSLSILKKSEILRVFPTSLHHFAILTAEDIEFWKINHGTHAPFYQFQHRVTLPSHQFLFAIPLTEQYLVAVVRKADKFSLFIFDEFTKKHNTFSLPDCIKPTQLAVLSPHVILIQDHLRDIQFYKIDFDNLHFLGKQRHIGGIGSESIVVSPDSRYLYEYHLIYSYLCFYKITNEIPFLDEIEIKPTETIRLNHLHSFNFKQGFLPDGRFIFVEGKKQNKLTVFDLQNYTFEKVLTVTEGPIVNLLISPHGKIDILTANGHYIGLQLPKSQEEKQNEKAWQQTITPMLNNVGVERDSASIIAAYSYPGLFGMRTSQYQRVLTNSANSNINLGPR